MSKKRKFLIALLSTAVMTAGAFGIAACGGGETATPNAEYYAAYQQYVAAENEAGRTPDAYQTWLENMLSEAKGEDGKSAYEIWKESPAGAASDMTEAQWLESLKGANGTGIASVELNEDGSKLIITYTDPNMPATEIELDETFHKHTYGKVEVLIAGDATTAGLGYKECSVDGHIELVKLTPYKFTVKKPDGTPVAGCTVKFGTETGTTDANGVAAFANNGAAHTAIDVEVPDELAATHGFLTAYTTDTQTDYTLELAPILSDYDTVSEAGKYIVNVVWFENWYPNQGTYFPGYTDIIFTSYADKNTHYTISVDESVGCWYCDDETQNINTEKPAGYTHEFNIAMGGDKTIRFSFDEFVYTDTSTPVSYYITITKSEGPVTGSEVLLPETLQVGENNLTIKSEAISGTKSAYCVLPATYGDTSKFKFTFGEEVTVDYYGFGNKAFEALQAGTAVPQEVASGVPIAASEYDNSYFIISTTDANGAAAVKVEEYYDLGHAKNPVTIDALGNVANTSATALVISYSGSWFKYECTETGTYVIEFTKGSGQGVYCEDEYLYGTDAAKNSVQLEAGKTYLFNVSLDDGVYDFNLRKPEGDKDKGYSLGDKRPIVLDATTHSATLSVEYASQLMYFELTEHGAGYYTVTATDKQGHPVKCVAEFTNGKDTFDRYHVSDANTYLVVTAYDENDFAITDYNLTVTYTADNAATDHKFTLKSGTTPIAGATVSVGYGDDFVEIATGTSNENGIVTLNFAPCDYEIRVALKEEDAKNYYIGDLTVDFDEDNTDRVLEFESKIDYTYTFKDAEGQPISGLKVFMWYDKPVHNGYEQTLIAWADSDENGVVTLSTFKSLAARGYYIEVRGTADYELATMPEFDSETLTYNVVVPAKVTYTITVNDENGAPLANVEVTVKDSKGNTATGTTDASGVATLNGKLVPGANKITCKGYTVNETTSAESTTATVTAMPITYESITEYMTFALTTEDGATYYKVTTAPTSGCLYFGAMPKIYVEVNGEIVISNMETSSPSCVVPVNVGDVVRIWTDNPVTVNPSMNNCTVYFE